MSSNSETGHAKNVANFEDLITRLESLGAAYAPSKTSLQLANLKVQHSAAAASLISLAQELPLYQQAVDAREAAFGPLNKLVTRALNMFKASVDNKPEVESATSLAKKVRGSASAKPAAVEGKEPTKKISTSQQSYDMVISNFQQFIEVLAAHAAYQPNEEELKIASLNALLATLKTTSQAVTRFQARLDTARTNRNAILYAEGDGVTELGIGVKTYVRGAFTPQTVNYQPILSLEFRKPRI